MRELVKNIIERIKKRIFPSSSVVTASSQARDVPVQPVATMDQAVLTEDPLPSSSIPDGWVVTPYRDPVFEKIGRVYMEQGDLVVRSDLDERGFLIIDEDLALALTGEIGKVRLYSDPPAEVGSARLSTSGLALNIIIDQQLHTIPLKVLTPVITGNRRKAPLFIPADALVPDQPG